MVDDNDLAVEYYLYIHQLWIDNSESTNTAFEEPLP